MSINKKVLATLVAAAVVVPGTASAYEIIGKKLEIYGKVHVSVDASDDDRGLDETSISSNSSRLGFKGKHMIHENLGVVYKIEQEVNFSSGGGNFATRNAYVGIKGGFGTVLVGQHDTPYKDVGSKWGMFGDSVGERRSILGAFDGEGNKMNNRGKNSIMYIGKWKPVEFRAMYSTDTNDTDSDGIDGEDNDLFATSLVYKTKKARVGIAYADYDNLNNEAEVDGWRLAGTYNFGKVKAGLIYETTDSDVGRYDRDVWGVNAAFKVNKNTTLKAQYLEVDDHEAEDDSGANKIGLGLFNKLDKQTTIYAAYGRTDNDDNANFQGVDGGHGDEIKTDDGGEPQAFSVGLIFKF